MEPKAVESDELVRTLKRRARPAEETQVMVWHDVWRNADRVLRWKGPCLGCGRQTWAFDDGQNDPRGVLGDAASWPVAVDGPDGGEVDVRACAICANDYDSYKTVQGRAAEVGLEAARPYGER